MVNAYKPLNVPTAVIADLDLLKNETELRNVVTALLGDYDTVRKAANEFRAALAEGPPVVSADTLLQELEKVTNTTAQGRRKLLFH